VQRGQETKWEKDGNGIAAIEAIGSDSRGKLLNLEE